MLSYSTELFGSMLAVAVIAFLFELVRVLRLRLDATMTAKQRMLLRHSSGGESDELRERSGKTASAWSGKKASGSTSTSSSNDSNISNR